LEEIPGQEAFDDNVIAMVKAYRPLFELVSRTIVAHGANKQPVRAAFTYMLLKNPHQSDEITEMARSYNNGLFDKVDDPLRRLRDYAMNSKARSGAEVNELFLKGIFAIQKALDDSDCQRLKKANARFVDLDGIFPLEVAVA
jgi:hypothetical protein